MLSQKNRSRLCFRDSLMNKLIIFSNIAFTQELEYIAAGFSPLFHRATSSSIFYMFLRIYKVGGKKSTVGCATVKTQTWPIVTGCKSLEPFYYRKRALYSFSANTCKTKYYIFSIWGIFFKCNSSHALILGVLVSDPVLFCPSIECFRIRDFSLDEVFYFENWLNFPFSSWCLWLPASSSALCSFKQLPVK